MYLLVRLRHGREQDAIDVKTRAQLIIRMRSRACLVGWKTFGVLAASVKLCGND